MAHRLGSSPQLPRLIPAGTGLREYTRQVVMTNEEHEAALAAKAAEEIVPTKWPSRAGKRETAASE